MNVPIQCGDYPLGRPTELLNCRNRTVESGQFHFSGYRVNQELASNRARSRQTVLGCGPP